MNDEQLLRYSRQIMLPQIDIEGQQQLLDSHILIIGAGGLGCPAAIYLAAAGIGQISIYDDDQVDLSNLQRQIAHYTDDIGTDKVISTRNTLKKINPDTRINAKTQRLEGEALDAAVQQSDLVLDCTDNFATRFAINQACVNEHTPLVSGAVIRFEGQVSVFTPGKNDSPCYHCLYNESGEDAQNCATHGVISPITGLVGSIQALEAIKQLTRTGTTLVGRLLLIDGMTMEFNSLSLKKNANCRVCGKQVF